MKTLTAPGPIEKFETGERKLLPGLIERLDAIRRSALAYAQQFESFIKEAHPRSRASARNLLHYLALRQSDIRELQADLAELGMSSLGRTEAHTLASLNAVLRILRLLDGDQPVEYEPAEVSFKSGSEHLQKHAEALLGPLPSGRNTRIMVTLPSEAADNFMLVRRLVEAGMDCVRINCAHDDEARWERMIGHVRRAEKELGRACKVLMDLGGPKMRTGPLQAGPRVVHLHPERDARGVALAPVSVWLSDSGVPPPREIEADVIIPVEREWLSQLRRGDRIHFIDARGKDRKLQTEILCADGCLATTKQSAYAETGIELAIRRKKSKRIGMRKSERAVVGELPPVHVPIVLKPGDTLLLMREIAPGAPAELDPDGTVLQPARVACTLPEILSSVRGGDAIRFDDGKIEGVVREISAEALKIEITLAKNDGSKLDADKGINFPDTHLNLRGLTAKDLADLNFVAKRADLVGMSFVNEPADVQMLQEELKKRGAGGTGIVLKIETRWGFQNLPWLLLAAMRSYPAGIMIARGDLAVECGWERMAEVQEEILWLCEAAHMPAIWATQVLENLAKTGMPSRAEITDAAMSQRAECVMLNKGPHIVDAIESLDNILRRMQGHQAKKMSMLRSLKVSSAMKPRNV
ncbi:MAG TPA: pyruvate kinase [Planctomycetota bacterium]|nr:pyruvate kinase [Planctomycetota bacterium]